MWIRKAEIFYHFSWVNGSRSQDTAVFPPAVTSSDTYLALQRRVKFLWPFAKKQCFENPFLKCQAGYGMLGANWGWQGTLDVKSTHEFFSFD